MRNPFALGFLVLNAAWSLTLVVAPQLAPTASQRGLDGHVNVMDHADRWGRLDAVAAFAYATGDLVCHQMEARSFSWNGNQFPVDARMLAAFLAANAGFALALRLPPRARLRDALLPVYPGVMRDRMVSRRQRARMATGFLALALGPAAADWSLQLLTPYESTNILRLATGAWLGALGALWLGAAFDALARPLPSQATTSRRGAAPPSG